MEEKIIDQWTHLEREKLRVRITPSGYIKYESDVMGDIWYDMKADTDLLNRFAKHVEENAALKARNEKLEAVAGGLAQVHGYTLQDLLDGYDEALEAE